MKFTRTEIPEVVIIEPKVHGDERGYFFESYRKDKLDDFLEYQVEFTQGNESQSVYGVLRGLHYQLPPFAQTKLVRVIKGEVLDVAVDIRDGSPTFGKYVSVILNESNKRQLFVPRGFAHGFVVLSEVAIFSYQVDNYYSPEHDRGILFDDKKIGIDWKISDSNMKLSPKDTKQLSFDSADLFDYGTNLYD